MYLTMGPRRVEGVAAGPHAVEQTRRGRRGKQVQKDRCLKTGGGGRGSQENLCKMFSARAAVARAASGRLDHGRRYLNRQLRAAGEALRFPLVNAMRHEQSRLYFQRLRDGAGSMGVKSSRMALRLLRATAAPASTTSLPNIFCVDRGGPGRGKT